MAIAVMNWVWKHSRSRNGARLVLLAIADCCSDDNGTGAWPSMATLMEKTGLSLRAVRMALRELEKLKELKVKPNAGPGGANVYAVLIKGEAKSAPRQNLPPRQDVPPAESAPGKSCTQERQNLPGGEAGSAPVTINEPSENHHSLPSEESPRTDSQTTGAEAKPAKTAKRGTRIPADFASTVTPEMVAWVRKKCPDVDGRDQTERFVDFWSDKTGKDATKIDWVGTWRNWMRREQDRINERGKRNRPSSGSPNSVPRSTTDERVAQVQALKSKYRSTPPAADDQQQTPPNTIPGVVVA